MRNVTIKPYKKHDTFIPKKAWGKSTIALFMQNFDEWIIHNNFNTDFEYFRIFKTLKLKLKLTCSILHFNTINDKRDPGIALKCILH